ncbi:MAG TPA: maleylpyruvate isomerase family mycothiol-dependent enzyme [Acidimicrobiia bacterium]|nr:maleylpyruvate isomerase family mycothiol-dependent enzyme [Acidimicrobiia bacterium]
MDGSEVDALADQLAELVTLVASLPDDDFALPTRCPGWAVAELVAHCEGILVRLVGENAAAVDTAPRIDRAGYYRFDPQGPREGDDTGRTFSEVVRDRVIGEVGGRTPSELRAALAAAVGTALDGIAAIPAERVIHRSGHPPITYGEFVASRNVEFVVHTMDVAHAVGRPERAAPASATVVVAILDRLLGDTLPASLGWDATTYILAATGRRDLTPDERERLGTLVTRFPLLA